MKFLRFKKVMKLGALMAVFILSFAGVEMPLAADISKPNIIVIMADDMGYGDVQALNPQSTIPTPYLDSLAENGMRFNDAHSPSAVCTPTRYGLITGRYCWRSSLTRGVLNGYSKSLIDPDRVTIADICKSAGYHTGVVGKWHLGLDFAPHSNPNQKFDFSKPVGNTPNAYGFDYSMIIPASLDFPPYLFVKNDKVLELPTETQEAIPFPAYLRSGEISPGFKPEDILDNLAEYAVEFIDRMAQSDNPFFLYFPLTSPHKPVLPENRFVGSSGKGLYGDFIIQTDWTIGQILQALEKNKIEDNTLVLFTSDNGSFMYRLAADEDEDHVSNPSIQAYSESSHMANFIFRGTKADVFEGGHHVPFLVKWPARIRAGSVSDRVTCHVDILATIADITGTEIPDKMAEDSFSFKMELMEEEVTSPRPPVINHSANGTFAIRQGSLKLILSNGSGGREKPSSKPFQKPYQLYDLDMDPREQRNLIHSNPETAQILESQFISIRAGQY